MINKNHGKSLGQLTKDLFNTKDFCQNNIKENKQNADLNSNKLLKNNLRNKNNNLLDNDFYKINKKY